MRPPSRATKTEREPMSESSPFAPSGRGCASKLSLERSNVSLAEAPLSSLLERRQQVLASELVDGIGADVEYLRHLFAVQVDVVPVEHRVRALRWMEWAVHTTAPKMRSS